MCRESDHTRSKCALLFLQPPANRATTTTSVTILRHRLDNICMSWNQAACIFPKNCSYRHVCVLLAYTAVSLTFLSKVAELPEAAGNYHHLYQYPSQQNINRPIITVIQTYISIVYTKQSVSRTYYHLIFKHLSRYYTLYLTESGVSEVFAPQYQH